MTQQTAELMVREQGGEAQGPQGQERSRPTAPEKTFLEQVTAIAAPAGEVPEPVRSVRRQAASHFWQHGFPSPRHEAWRFTNLKPVISSRFEAAPAGRPLVDGELLDRWRVSRAARLVFVNGGYVEDLSSIGSLPSGVVVSSLERAIRESPGLVEAELGRHARFDDQAFVALNTAAIRDGAFVWLPEGVVLERPIHLVWISSPGEAPTVSYPRALVVASRSSQAEIVESYLGSDASYLSCPVTELVLGDGASLEHCRVQEESVDAHHLGALQMRLSRDSRAHSTAVTVGAAVSRLDINAVLAGPGADASLDGLYLSDGSQHVDHHLRLHHAAPNATSNQLFKGVLDGSSRAVFDGKIVVDQIAQRTDARQSNRNLLLSDRARVSSNPQLEILADDVRCTHGSTVGQLDEEALFYLRSRGIPRAAAESLLTYAFAGDIVHRIQQPEIRERMESILLERLPEGELVREAV